MADLKGFGGWVEIFKGGKQIDDQGKEHDGDALLDKAVSSFNAAEHEPPAVIGHPKDNAPAYGWVAGLKKEGDRLLAQFKDVVPEFAEMVAQGLFKKRSASFYADGRLRHVGFLGAAPPAVKGLADLEFEEAADAVTFEFGEASGTIARVFRRLRDWLIEKHGVETADKVIPDWDVEYIQDEAKRPQTEIAAVPAFAEAGQGKTHKEDPMKNFTEADLKAAEEKGAAAAKEEAEAEFAEKESKRQAGIRKQEIADFVDQGVAAGKIAPAWVKAGLKEFMEQIDGEESICFAEGDDKQTPGAWFQDFLEGLPKLVEFAELAGRAGDPGDTDNQDAEDIARRATEFQESEAKAGRTITVTQAVAHVTKGK